MSVSSISGTQMWFASDLISLQHVHGKKKLNESTGAALVSSTGSPAENTNNLASAIAAELMQLGLTYAPSAAGSGNTAATSSMLLAPLAQPPRGLQQIQQYKNIASTFSNVAQTLSFNSSSTSSAANGAGSLSTVLQNLWTSLSSSSGASADSSSNTVPSFPLFLQTMARNFGESGISGLRGVFVDTLA